MPDIAPLGFAIDTDALQKAGVAASNTGQNLSGMGVAADDANKRTTDLGRAVEKATDSHKKHAVAAKETTEALKVHTAEAVAAKKALDELAVAHEKVAHSAKASKQAHVEAIQGHHEAIQKSAALAAQHQSHLAGIVNFHAHGNVSGRDSEYNVPGHRGLLETHEVVGAERGIARAFGSRRFGPSVAVGRIAELGATAVGSGVLGIAEFGAIGLGVALLAEKLYDLGKEIIKAGDAAQQTTAKFQGLSGNSGGRAAFEGFAHDADHSASYVGREAYINAGYSVMRDAQISQSRAQGITLGLARLNAAGGGDDKSLGSATSVYASAIRDGKIDFKELNDLEKSIPNLAKHLGDSEEHLHAMASDGKLTASAFEQMMSSSGSGLDKQISGMADHFHTATTQLKNDWDRMLENMANSTGFMALADKIVITASKLAEAKDPAPGHRNLLDFSKPSAAASVGAPSAWHMPAFGAGTLSTQAAVIREAKRQGVDVDQALQVLFNESRGRADVGWHHGGMANDPAFGPMGLTRGAAAQVGVSDAERQTLSGNIRGGVAYLKYTDKMAGGNLVEGARIYHAGPAGPRGPVNAAYGASMPSAQERADTYDASFGSKITAAQQRAADLRKQAAALAASGDHDGAARFNEEARRADEEARGGVAGQIGLLSPETPFTVAQRGLSERAAGLNDAGITSEAMARSYQMFREGRANSPSTLVGEARGQVLTDRRLGLSASSIALGYSNEAGAGLARAESQGPEAVRLAEIAQRVAQEGFTQFGRNAQAAAAELSVFAARTREASDQQQRRVEGRAAFGQTQTLIGQGNLLGAGYEESDHLAAQRSEEIRRATLGFGSGAAAGYAVVQGRINRTLDLNTAKDQLDPYRRQLDDLRASAGIAGLSPNARRAAQAGIDAGRQFEDHQSTLTGTPEFLAYKRQISELAVATEKAKQSLERYTRAHDEISGAISGAGGSAVRSVGGLAMDGQLNLKSFDQALANAIKPIGATIIDNLIAKPLEHATEGVANHITDWLMHITGNSVDDAAKATATAGAAASLAALNAAATSAAAALANLTGAAGGSSIASAIGSAIGLGSAGSTATMSSELTPIAFGAAFRSGVVTPLGFGGSLGRILNGPTITPMANGSALAGEVSAEAVLPLKRGADGKLGVGGGGGGGGDVQVVVNDMRSSGHPVQTSSSQGPDGKRMISMTIRDEVRSGMGGGEYDASMRGRYGAQPVIARR